VIRLAVDGTPLLGARTGIGEVVAGLVAALAEREDLDVTAYAVTWRGRGQLRAAVPAGVRAATAPLPARLVRRTWLRGEHPAIERWTGPVDVVHATNYVGPPTSGRSIVSVYDLGFVRFPELCTPDALQYPALIERAIARGAWIHTTSDHVAAEVREAFTIPEERLLRVYPGIPSTDGGDPTAGRAVARADRYVLFLGTIEPRKNLPLLVGAFDAVAAEDPDVVLVVAGASGWGAEAFTDACSHARHRDRIRQLGYVSARDRRDLLAGAAVLAYPSRYEGFGFPPLEAMAARVPVVASCAGAIPEVVGDAAVLVDPDDAAGLASGLLEVLQDDARRRVLVERGVERLERFSWARMASELADGYARMLA
jgi:glycosyltransferase involved in cell wall biosynthesis